LIIAKVVSFAAAIISLTAIQQAQAVELIMELHEDYSVTFKTLNDTKIKGYANLEGAAGQHNGIIDVVEQMELWN
jgi:hypothetical protein